MKLDQLLLALDFGGTKLTAGLTASGERRWRAHRQVPSPPGSNAQSDLENMMALAQDLLATAEAPLAAVGASFGGPVNAAQGLVLLSHHVPGWEKVPLREWLEERLGVAAVVDNDANAGALGEHRFGAGQGCDSLMYITVSTGVGGGCILDGRLWRGADGMAGEIGHTVVDPDGPLCLCGKRGCVERLASGPYIAQRAREWLRAQPDRGWVLRALAGGDPSIHSGQAPSIHSGQAPSIHSGQAPSIHSGQAPSIHSGQAPSIHSGQAPSVPSGQAVEAITAKLVAQGAAQGDDLAWEILEVAAWALGVGIGNAANLVNPERFVLGGGVTKAGERFWEVVRRTARETALPEVHFDVVPAALGDDAPLWGAVALAEDVVSAE